MSKILITSAILFSSMSFACPNMTGDYTCKIENVENQKPFEMSLEASSNSVTFIQGNSKTTYITDSKFHVSPDNEKIHTKSSCVEDNFKIVQNGILDLRDGSTMAFTTRNVAEQYNWGYISTYTGFTEDGPLDKSVTKCISNNVELEYNGEPHIDPVRVQGNKSAPVTIVAYLNPQSRMYANSIKYLRDIQKQYKDQVNIIHKFDNNGSLLGGTPGDIVAAYTNGILYKYPRLISSFMDHLREVYMYGRVTTSQLKSKFNKFLENNDIKPNSMRFLLHEARGQQISKQDKEEMFKLDINQSPSFLVNGNIVRGLPPIEYFGNVIKKVQE